jgi:hypothetical protein
MATIYVKKDGSGDALTIQQGIQLAALGDIVEIEAGTFDENIDLWKGVTLKGAGIGSTIVTTTLRIAPTALAFVFVTGQTTLNLTQAAIDSGASTVNYQVGRIVTASGIPTNTRIISKTPTSLTLSAAVTSAAASRTIAMAVQNDAGLRVRGSNGVIRDLKIVGFDHPTNPGVEYSAIYFRNAGLGSSAANGWEVFNCEFEANGEYALLCDSTSAIGNLNIHNCKISGKTFVGENPAVGNQYSVWNVPRQLVTIQPVNFNIIFQNNQITGITGGLTIDGIPSYNTAVTIDAVGAIISGNTIDTESGTGYALRVRGLNADVSNNAAVGTSAGYYILPNHSLNVIIPVGTMIFNSTKYWVCIQEHTSSSTNAPTGVDGALYWSEITLEDVNASGEYGVGLVIIGSNGDVSEVLVNVSQLSAGEPIKVTMSKALVKSLPKVAQDALFSNESNWKLVSFIFKKNSSAQRLVSAFRDFEAEKSVKLKSGMVSGNEFELHKIIISTPDRALLVMKRDEIEDAESFDFILQ